MLYELGCDLFAEKKHGKLEPRPMVHFRKGLNTVLGDKQGQNSIGKSTFLLAIDFAFGGDDYLDRSKNNVLDFVDSHDIKFAFKFGERIEYYRRNTTAHNVVTVCNAKYEPTDTVLTLDAYMSHIRRQYRIETAENSLRGIIGLYFRIYGRDNYNERHPLKYGDTTDKNSITELEKLYGVYSKIKEIDDYFTEQSTRQRVRKKGTELGEIVTIATSKSQVKANLKEIDELQKELDKLTNEQDVELSKRDTERLDNAAVIKGQLAVMRRKRSRLVSRLNAIKNNIEGGQTPVSEDMAELQQFFPNVNLEQIEKIENFHHKMQTILTGEMSEEIEQLELLIRAATEEVERLENKQRELGVPTRIPKKFLERAANIQRRIDLLKQQNKGYEESKKLQRDIKDAKEQLAQTRESQLSLVESMINQEMERLNDYIYDGERYAPEIHFQSTRKGNPTYTFGCRWNSGTGENYKNLIIFDLSILKTTELPVLIHDSLIFKNVADLPIDKIMHLYMESDKQIFIAFDKKDAFSKYTSDTVYETRVLELHDNGGELFGWSWDKKSKKTNTEENKTEADEQQ